MLHFDGLIIQSQMSLDDPDTLALDYTRTMMAFLLLSPSPRHIAMIGLGGGSLAKYCLRTLPHTRFTAVDIDPAVIALRDAFDIPRDDSRLEIRCEDGAKFVRDHELAPDVLIVDGFDLSGQPPQLCSAGFYDHCHSLLAADGTLVVNLWSGDPRYGLYTSRIRDSFENRVIVMRAPEDHNHIVFACKNGPFPPPRARLLERARALAAAHPVDMPALARLMVQGLDRHSALQSDE